MDAARNPYAPGAGTPPPTLAGRDALLDSARLALSRIKLGRQAKSFVAVGLRGVGKTVIMNEVQKLAEAENFHVIYLEAYDEISLPSALAKALRPVLLKVSGKDRAHHLAVRALAGLRNFASVFKVKIGDVDLSINAEEGLADTGDIMNDLPDLLVSVGEAAKATGSAVSIIIDEVQYLSERDMSALIMAMHRCSQKSLPVVLFGAGLPQLRAKMGDAKTYVERLLDFPQVDALSDEAARLAIEKPAKDEDVDYTPGALHEILRVTAGYPYFIQEWGHFAWLAARSSPITQADVVRSHAAAIQKLDESFFRVRLDRMTPTERRYMRALAQLGPGSHRSGDIAKTYGARVTSVAPLRSSLIAKGMIYSPAHGDTAFTVPLFDEFMRREQPWPAD